MDSSDLPYKLKAFILDKLDALHQAINFYDISGAASIYSASETIWGSYVTIKYHSEWWNNENAKTTWKKMLNFAFKTASVIQFIDTCLALPEKLESIKNSLPFLSN